MMLRWFGLFAGSVRVALILVLLALVALALMIIGHAALTIRASVESPPASPAPLPTGGAAAAAPAPLLTGGAAAAPAPLPPVGAAATPRAGGAPDAAVPTDSSSAAAHRGAVDAAPLRDAMIAAWQCARARRGLPPLVIDSRLDAAAVDLHRTALTEGRPALESAAARYYEVRVGALPMELVAAMGCDAPPPDGAAPPDAAVRRIGLALIGPSDGGGAPYAPVSFVLIGVTEEWQP